MYFDDNRAAEGHSRRALRGGAVSIVARVANAFIQIGTVLFLARLLSPEDYGLVGMVTALTGFAQLLVDLGSRDAVVQRPTITEQDVSGLFWICLGVGTAFALTVAGCGPLIARFYREPRLTMIAVVSAVTFINSALTVQHYALMRRAMMFREIGTVEVVANLIAAVLAIGAAFMGFGYWALVLRSVLATFLIAVGVWYYCRWIPRRPTVTPAVKEMLKFGLNVTGFTMTDFAGRSGDRVAIGYRIGATGLGYYQNAMFVYDNLLDVIITQLHGVAVAGFSKLGTNLNELRRLWAKAVSTLAFFSMPAYGLLAVTSQDLIRMLLGKKWTQAGILLSVLALRGIPHCIERTIGWLHVTGGRTDRWMRWGVVSTCIQLTALFIGVGYGPMGVATAYVIVTFALFIPAVAYAGAPFGIGVRDLMRAIWRPLVAVTCAVIAGFAARPSLVASMGMFPRVVTLTAIFSATYLFLVSGVFGLREPAYAAFGLIRDVLPARIGPAAPKVEHVESV